MRFCVIASGPSLTHDDVELIRQSDCRVIAVNSSHKIAPWADHVFAADCEWWTHNHGEISKGPALWTSSKSAYQRFPGVKLFDYRGGGNSGLQAIRLAMTLGASEIILLGFDCSVKNGAHWHGDHTATKNPDDVRCATWRRQFEQLPKTVRIINCSRETEITAFARARLEDVIG